MDAKVLRDRNLIASINSDARTTRAGLEPSHTPAVRAAHDHFHVTTGKIPGGRVSDINLIS